MFTLAGYTLKLVVSQLVTFSAYCLFLHFSIYFSFLQVSAAVKRVLNISL